MIKNVFLAIYALMILAACGIKPGAVDPPEGADPGVFPRTYPDTQHDP